MEQPRQSLLGRVWGDIRANPGVWVGVGIAVLILIVGIAAYSRQRSSPSSAATSGQPQWGAASVGNNPGGTPSDAELAAELAAIAAYVQSQQTPNAPGTAAPTFGGVLPLPSRGVTPSPAATPLDGALHVGYTNAPNALTVQRVTTPFAPFGRLSPVLRTIPGGPSK